MCSLLVAAVICCSGCAAEKPKIYYPSIPCPSCELPVESKGCYDKAKEVSATGALIIIQATDEFLSFLQKTEKYLQDKLQEFQVTHPELVNETKDTLNKLQDRIKEYKESLIKRM